MSAIKNDNDIPVTPGKRVSILFAIKSNDAKIEQLREVQRALRQELAEEVSPFRPGDRVHFVWGRNAREGEVMAIEAAAFPPYYALTVKPVLKSGELGAAIRIEESYNKVQKAA